MKKLLFAFAIFLVLRGNAQTYLISFAGTGVSTTVNTVIVENLTVGTTIILNGNDILRLTGITGVFPIENKQSSEMKIYPNPMTGSSTMEISPPAAGDAIISVCEMTGKPIAQIHSYLENNQQQFRLSGIKSGFYLINVKGNNYQYSGRLLCNDKASGNISIVKISNNQAVAENKSKTDNKGTQATIDMAYSTGDRLKFTGISGIYSTVITDIPTQDKTISFNLIACSDGDNNNYPVVEIGTQIWMAENLKTTKFKDETIIPLVTDSISWYTISTPAYCWYNNNETANKATYGALYNWYSVSTLKLCPTGWHEPSRAEWITLTDYLEGTYYAGGKLKETGTTHWAVLNTGATNETGFTALPGGERIFPGSFIVMGGIGGWWSTTEDAVTSDAWHEQLMGSNIRVEELPINKYNGLSVRCLKD